MAAILIIEDEDVTKTGLTPSLVSTRLQIVKQVSRRLVLLTRAMYNYSDR